MYKVKNSVENGETAEDKHFLLLLQFFQKSCTAGTKSPGKVVV